MGFQIKSSKNWGEIESLMSANKAYRQPVWESLSQQEKKRVKKLKEQPQFIGLWTK